MSISTDAYINFSNVKGESEDHEYKEWTAVRTFAFALSNTLCYDTSTPGLGAGTVSVGDLQVELVFDKACITLRQYLVQGTHIDSTKLKVRRQGGTQVPWYSLEMDNAVISESKISYGDGYFFALVFIKFKAYKEAYIPQDNKGAKGAEIQYKWIPAKTQTAPAA
ncbi:type VI secretion system protein EvpC [Xenorhabdus mauleonii]|uniref:Type VI secretion system protein EvpC n=1 Tax=Xenorhabdus mauleonii TaxID=351675 RepID=A0A1I3NLM5_9GAMM|nr:type VI secretion system tube protein Hcp [Xenorhabdus mauleonii]PHM45642.1 type VI secretion system protein EvpC [Xenorhabdus mauleonii]SFJ10089.1 type VI secretion system secreted protein Hcp [Xenorhabdus mauleonii]